MYVQLYIALVKFALDFCHVLLRPRKLKNKSFKLNYKSALNAFGTYNKHYGPKLS